MCLQSDNVSVLPPLVFVCGFTLCSLQTMQPLSFFINLFAVVLVNTGVVNIAFTYT